MSNFFVALAVFLITVVGALFTVPYFIDWNGYRGVFEEEASRLLGREVRVGGAVNLHLLPTPYFRFEKVRIADASVNLEEPFFRTDSLTVKLSVPPAAAGARSRPTRSSSSGRCCAWRSTTRAAGTGRRFGQVLSNAPYLPTNVALTSLKIKDGVLAVHGVNGAERTRIEGLDGELSSPSLDGPYRFRGTYRHRRRRARDPAVDGQGRGRRHRALQGHAAPRRCRLGLQPGRPPARPDGQVPHGRRADRPAAGRQHLAARARRASSSSHAKGADRRGQGAGQRRRLRPQGQRRRRRGRRHPLRPRPVLRAGRSAAAADRRRQGRLARCAGRRHESRLALARPRPHRRARPRIPRRSTASCRWRCGCATCCRPTAARARASPSTRPTSVGRRSAACAWRWCARATSSRSRSCGSACRAAAAASCRAPCRVRPTRPCSTARSACAA